jgi:hypothetical protein
VRGGEEQRKEEGEGRGQGASKLMTRKQPKSVFDRLKRKTEVHEEYRMAISHRCVEGEQLAPIKIQSHQAFIIQLNKPNNNIRVKGAKQSALETLIAAPLQAKRKSKAQTKARVKTVPIAPETVQTSASAPTPAVAESAEVPKGDGQEEAPIAKSMVKR